MFDYFNVSDMIQTGVYLFETLTVLFGRKSMTKLEQGVTQMHHWNGRITSQWHLLNA